MGMVKRFTRLCFLCYLKGDLKKLQNHFFSLGYPGNLVSKVITRARSSTALKTIDPQSVQCTLNFLTVENFFEIFNIISDEVN